MKKTLSPSDRPNVIGRAVMERVLLPGLPIDLILQAYASAPRNEIESGKFESPESSAALAANAFGRNELSHACPFGSNDPTQLASLRACRLVRRGEESAILRWSPAQQG
jgi:hypothetical protein